ncbi:MAG: ParB/RepB/Spo0J family partition protein [Planctomycetota bacterium]
MPTPIALTDLRAHPANSNTMPAKRLAKLAAHIGRTGRYPPVIVRPLGDAYQVLDGHHRVKALTQLGHDTAQCEVWDVDDREALILLATLNRLEGGDDPRKRGALVSALRGQVGLPALAKLLPEDTGRLRALSALHDAPPPRPLPPAAVGRAPVAVTFFMSKSQRHALDARLRAHGGPREAALLELIGANDDR